MNVQTEEYFGVAHFESKVYFSFPISSLEFLEQRAYIYLILLHFALLCFANIERFYKLKVCGNTALTKYVGAIFPTAFAYFIVSVSYFSNFHNNSFLQ